MKKSVVITIMLDNVIVSELDILLADIEQAIKKYENKRITVTMQDEPLVSPRFG